MNTEFIIGVLIFCLMNVIYFCLLYYIYLVYEGKKRRAALADRMSRP